MSRQNISLLSSLHNLVHVTTFKPLLRLFTIFEKQDTTSQYNEFSYGLFLDRDIELEVMEMGMDKYHVLYDTQDNIIEISTINPLYKIQQLV